MADVEFKVIEQADSIEDGDYVLTVQNGEIKKVLKSDAKLGGGGEPCIAHLASEASPMIFPMSIMPMDGSIPSMINIVRDSVWEQMLKGNASLMIHEGSIENKVDTEEGLSSLGGQIHMANDYLIGEIKYDGTVAFKYGLIVYYKYAFSGRTTDTMVRIMSASNIRKMKECYESGKDISSYLYGGGAPTHLASVVSKLEEIGYFDAE